MNNSSAELEALHSVLIRVRFIAPDVPPSAVVAIMDSAEYLVTLIMKGENCDGEYALVLEDIGRIHPRLSSLAEQYRSTKRAEPAALREAA